MAFPQDKNPLVINWEVSLDGGQSWIAFGETRNVIYRVLSDPIVNTLYDLALTKACTYADGESTPLGAAQKICDGIDFDIYYDPSDTIGSEANPLKLYDTGVGMCEDHARLMSLLLKSIGIDVDWSTLNGHIVMLLEQRLRTRQVTYSQVPSGSAACCRRPRYTRRSHVLPLPWS